MSNPFAYRKKPVVIEAFQLTEETRKNNNNWPQWAHAAWNEGNSRVGALYPKYFGEERGALFVNTLEGPLTVSIGDWIIRGVNGELYPCKPDIFEKTYEKV